MLRVEGHDGVRQSVDVEVTIEAEMECIESGVGDVEFDGVGTVGPRVLLDLFFYRGLIYFSRLLHSLSLHTYLLLSL